MDLKPIYKIIICATCIGLPACSNEDGSQSGNTIVAPETPSIQDDHVVFTIFNVKTKGNPKKPEQGFGCSIGMSIENKSDKELELVQINKYTIVANSGKFEGRQSNFSLAPRSTTKRAGIYAKNMDCKDVTTVNINELTCMYDISQSSLNPEFRCDDNVHLRSIDGIGFAQSD